MDRPFTIEPVAAWKFPRGLDLAVVAEVVDRGGLAPDLRLAVVATEGEVITARLVEGPAPDDPSELLYIAPLGAFEVVRRSWWPERAGRALLLTLVRR